MTDRHTHLGWLSCAVLAALLLLTSCGSEKTEEPDAVPPELKAWFDEVQDVAGDFLEHDDFDEWLDSLDAEDWDTDDWEKWQAETNAAIDEYNAALEDLRELSDGISDRAEAQTDSGVLIVGSEIEPGTYRVNADPDDPFSFGVSCKRLDADLETIDFNFGENSVLCKVVATDYAFEYSGRLELLESAVPEPDSAPAEPVSGVEALPGGCYLVGEQIPPGRYRINGDGLRFWFTHDNDDCTSLTLRSGTADDGEQLLMTLRSSDVSVEFKGQLERIE